MTVTRRWKALVLVAMVASLVLVMAPPAAQADYLICVHNLSVIVQGEEKPILQNSCHVWQDSLTVEHATGPFCVGTADTTLKLCWHISVRRAPV